MYCKLPKISAKEYDNDDDDDDDDDDIRNVNDVRVILFTKRLSLSTILISSKDKIPKPCSSHAENNTVVASAASKNRRTYGDGDSIIPDV